MLGAIGVVDVPCDRIDHNMCWVSHLIVFVLGFNFIGIDVGLDYQFVKPVS